MPANPPVSDLTAHLGYWLRMVSNHVSHAFAAKLAEKEVTVAEWCLLRLLYGKPPTPPSRLAIDMGMTKGAITKLADRLIKKSLLLREASQNDGRAQTLALTSGGAVLVPQLAALADRNDSEFFGGLTEDQRKALETLLRALAHKNQISSLPIS